MKRFWQIIALVLLALMVPASVCCFLTPDACSDCDCESHPVQHEESPAVPNSCPSDSIAHSEVPLATVLPEIQMVDLINFFHTVSVLNEIPVAEFAEMPLLTDVPPDLRTTWVFSRRAAVPARAPSALV